MSLTLLFNFLNFLHPIKADYMDDIWKSIEDGFRSLLMGGIKNCFKYIIELLSQGVSGDNGIGGLMGTYLQNSPSAIDSGLWTSIQDLSKSTIVPIALTIVAIVSVSDMFQMVTSGNNMRDFDTSIFFKWIIKTEIALTLVGKSFVFVSLVFQEGANIATKGYVKVGDFAASKNLNATLNSALKDYQTYKLLIILGLAFLTLIAVYGLFVSIIVVLCSRTIEAVMYLSIAPIPMATWMNNEFRQVGNAWARGIFALAFQSFFIIIALAFFKSMFNNVITDVIDKKDMVWNMAKMCGYSIALIFTIFRTGQISKTMFSAH